MKESILPPSSIATTITYSKYLLLLWKGGSSPLVTLGGWITLFGDVMLLELLNIDGVGAHLKHCWKEFPNH